MKTITQKGIRVAVNAVFITALALPNLLQAQASKIAISNPPFGLPRLGGLKGPSGEKPLDPRAFELIDLAATDLKAGNVVLRERANLKYLDILPETQWRQVFRPAKQEINYVTFTLYGSIGTSIDVGGALIRIQASSDGQYAALYVGFPSSTTIEWKPLSREIHLHRYDGQVMGALLVTTVKTDSSTGMWALSFGGGLFIDGLPLDTARFSSNRAISVSAGKEGAWVCEVACSDENPAFEDLNNNSVPDSFERENLGQLLSVNTSPETIGAIIQALRQSNAETLPVLHLNIPAPDPPTLEERERSNGQPIHGQPSSIMVEVPAHDH